VILIGELINGTRKSISKALQEKNVDYIKKLVSLQVENGADYIDINAGTGKGPQQEKEDLEWLVDITNEFVGTGVCIDSSDTEVIRYCLPLVKNNAVMLNSLSGETEKVAQIIPLLQEYPNSKVICLTMDDSGIPSNIDKKIEITQKLLGLLEKIGIKQENVFIDALVQPISTDWKNGILFLDSLKAIKERFPSVMTTCGLSNISFGLPSRTLVNKYFLAVGTVFGLDSVIADPCDAGIKEAICLGNVLSGKDEFCMNFIRMIREKNS